MNPLSAECLLRKQGDRNGKELPGLESQSHHLPAMLLWAYPLAGLSLPGSSFLCNEDRNGPPHQAVLGIVVEDP